PAWRVAAGIALVWRGQQGGHHPEEPRRNRSADGFPVSRPDSVKKLQWPKRLRARETFGAWRVLSNLPRSTNFDRRPGAQLPGARAIFQCQEERLASGNLYPGNQRRRAGTIGAFTNT